jgi:hypothetical protein
LSTETGTTGTGVSWGRETGAKATGGCDTEGGATSISTASEIVSEIVSKIVSGIAGRPVLMACNGSEMIDSIRCLLPLRDGVNTVNSDLVGTISLANCLYFFISDPYI